MCVYTGEYLSLSPGQKELQMRGFIMREDCKLLTVVKLSKARHILGLQIISLFCRITKILQVSGKLQNHEMARPRVRGYVRITSFDISFFYLDY